MESKSKTALGIDENIEGLLCYVLGFITGILFLVLEKDGCGTKLTRVQVHQIMPDTRRG